MSTLINLFDRTRPVLIVDDCPMYRTAAKGMLQKLGFHNEQLLVAKDAASALTVAKTKQLQLVMCDYNLGNKTNGHQLLDEILHDGHLPADCVVVIVTGDASAPVVRSFAELEPDGYLVKPLNFVTLGERLPKMARRKRKLGGLLESYAKGDYEAAVQQADEEIFKASEMATSAQLIKAKALIKHNKLDEARNQLIALRNGSEKGQVAMALATIAMKQKQYKTCLALLEPIEKDPILCAAAMDMSANVLIQQHQFSAAAEKLDAAINQSPKQVNRYQLRAQVAMGMFTPVIASQNIQQALLRSKHSFRETLEIHQLNASLTLDNAQLSEAAERTKLLSRFAEQCREWRSNFQRNQYKPMELLFLARANALRGYVGKARSCLAEYHTTIKELDNYQSEQHEMIELAKVQLLLSNAKSYNALMTSVSEGLAKDKQNVAYICFLRYISGWRARVEEMAEKATRLRESSLVQIKDGNYERAAGYLAQALELNRADPDIPKTLMVCLTKAWPMGWSKNAVGELAVRCRDLLLDTSAIYSAEFQRASQILASQLQIRELEFANKC
ncbi:response regulator [Corallincola holothuriorum]|uniref:Response regulator n=1 Tax=Corallincola holothuriorum TaxID=2282215 RepID=A0A368NPZ2_9GAMM|nr:response regulator [Corallincola holothuriorum]RCU52468.1 response regulator [Corallincola holothuriorum]